MEDIKSIHTAEISKPVNAERILRGEFSYENGKLDFKRHTQNVKFSEVLEAITALKNECQRQIDNQHKCPFHKPVSTIELPTTNEGKAEAWDRLQEIINKPKQK